MRGAAVKLAAPWWGELGLAEGVEDALSVLQLTGVPCWAVCGAARLREIDLPDDVMRVTIFRDNDEAGIAAAERAEWHYRSVVGVAARIWAPPGDGVKDWNQILQKRIQYNGR